MCSSDLDFWEELKRSADVEGVVVGRDFRFGRSGEGTPALLERFCREDGLLFAVEELLERDGVKISSFAIRSRIRRGNTINRYPIAYCQHTLEQRQYYCLC